MSTSNVDVRPEHWDTAPHVAFTGTLRGMTQAQRDTLGGLILGTVKYRPLFFHHGNAIGADAEADHIAHDLGLLTVVHPAVHQHQSYLNGDAAYVFPPAPPLVRNRIMVEMCSMLFAAPKGFTEVQRSGTWATVRYGRKSRLPIWIIWPDGTFTKEEGQ